MESTNCFTNKATKKQQLARVRNYNKRRIACTRYNLICMLNTEGHGLTLEEKDSIHDIIKITNKLLDNWQKTVNPI